MSPQTVDGNRAWRENGIGSPFEILLIGESPRPKPALIVNHATSKHANDHSSKHSHSQLKNPPCRRMSSDSKTDHPLAAPASLPVQLNRRASENDCLRIQARSSAPVLCEKKRVQFSAYGNRIYPTYSTKVYDRRWSAPRYTKKDKPKIKAELDDLRYVRVD